VSRRVTVGFEADQAYLRVARLTAAGLAADAGLSVHEIDDLSLAVDEMTAALISVGDGQISLVMTSDDRGVVVEGTTTASGAAELDPIAESIVTRASDKFRLDTDPVRFTLVKLAQALA
jgi:anti-sigma regulatory factor (Ser/Thr protein kinase)